MTFRFIFFAVHRASRFVLLKILKYILCLMSTNLPWHFLHSLFDMQFICNLLIDDTFISRMFFFRSIQTSSCYFFRFIFFVRMCVVIIVACLFLNWTPKWKNVVYFIFASFSFVWFTRFVKTVIARWCIHAFRHLRQAIKQNF